MSYRILIAFRDSTYTGYLVKELGAKHHVDVVRSINDINALTNQHNYDIAMLDLDFQEDNFGWQLVKLMRSSSNWNKRLAIMLGVDSNYREEMPKISQELLHSIDYIMVLPRYLLTVLDDMEEAVQSANKRQRK